MKNKALTYIWTTLEKTPSNLVPEVGKEPIAVLPEGGAAPMALNHKSLVAFHNELLGEYWKAEEFIKRLLEHVEDPALESGIRLALNIPVPAAPMIGKDGVLDPYPIFPGQKSPVDAGILRDTIAREDERSKRKKPDSKKTDELGMEPEV